METYLIELTNSNAYRLLQDLEEMKIIKVLKKENVKKQNVSKSSTARFQGALNLTPEQYESFQKHAKNIREEWGKNI